MSSNKTINIIGNILMLLSFVFIVNKIIKYKISFINIFSTHVFLIIIISIIIYAIIVITLAKLFQKFLIIFSGSEISINNSLYIYCKSNLFKYLPGNIFHYVGRNQIAIDEGVSHSTLNSTSTVEILFLSLASIITALVFAGQYTVIWFINNYYINLDIYAILIIILLIGFLSIPTRFSSSIKDWFTKYINIIRRIKFNIFVKFIIAYITTFILNGILFIMVLYSIGGNLSNNLILPAIGMYAFSWMIGFVTPGSPAGLGIREAIMSALLFGALEKELVIATVVLYRIVTILGDILGFIIAYILNRGTPKVS